MRSLWIILTRRPAATLYVVRTGLALAMAFGLHWSAEQMAAVMFFTEGVLALFGYSTTTPNAKLDPATVTLAKMGEKP